LKWYDKVIENWSDNIPTSDGFLGKVDIFYNKASCLYHLNKYEEALVWFNKALEKNTEYQLIGSSKENCLEDKATCLKMFEKIKNNEQLDNKNKATNDLINAIATNPVYALEPHKEVLQKYFDKSPEEGSEKMRAVYFEYFYLNMNLFDICAFKTLGNERKTKFLNILGRPIIEAAIEKYFEGVSEENLARVNINLNKATEEYSKCEELFAPLERAFSEKAMSTILSKRINNILEEKDELHFQNTIHNNMGFSLMHLRQPEIYLADLITESAKELGV
jgi:tetratricopeptide (TPR) repeat protein